MNQVSPGKLTMILGGAFTFLFSFLSWYSGGGTSVSGWSSDTLPELLPFGFFVGMFGLAVALAVGLPAFTEVKLPEKVLDFSVAQLVVFVGVFNVLVTLCLILGAGHGASAGFGLILCFLGSVAVVVGWVLDLRGVGVHPAGAAGAAAPGTAPPPPQGYAPPPQQGYEPPPPQQPQAPQGPPSGYPPPQPPPAQQPAPPQGPPPGYPPQQPQQQQPGYPPPTEPPNTGAF
jgi:hypothetical protein